MLIAVATLASCSNSNKENKEKEEEKEDQVAKVTEYLSLLHEAENSEEIITTIPFGLSFEMTKKDMETHLQKLNQNPDSNNIIRKDKENVFYCYFNHSSRKYRARISSFPSDWEDKSNISSFVFTFKDDMIDFPNQKNDEALLLSDLKNKFKNGFTYAECTIGDKDNSYTNYYCWIKDNLVIYATQYPNVFFLTFSNAPKNIPSFMFELEQNIINEANLNKELEKLEKQQQKDVKVENSSWDGSVYQVKEYLKRELKDPDSYESIEWTDVQNTDDGYTVRHKYRAKNSFGGYVIENQTFFLDYGGNVTNVVSGN